MQSFWLNRKNNKKLIIFFSGWGMDANSVVLEYGDFDFIVFYDYEDFTISNNLIEEFLKYNEVYIIAWSMGVVVSTLLINTLNNIKQKIAVNGTLKIIDDEFGISTKIFTATLNNLSETSIKSFFQNMGYEDFKMPNRNFKSQLSELVAIENFYKSNTFNVDFDKVIIGTKDIIVPYRNQKRAWKNQNCLYLNCGHYIFHLYNSWEDLLLCE